MAFDLSSILSSIGLGGNPGPIPLDQLFPGSMGGLGIGNNPHLASIASAIGMDKMNPTLHGADQSSIDLSLAGPILAGLMGQGGGRTAAPIPMGASPVNLRGSAVPGVTLPSMNPVSLRQRLTGSPA